MPLQADKFRSWLPHGFDFESIETTKSRLKKESQIREIFKNNQLVEVTPPHFDFSNTFSLINKRNHRSGGSFEFMGGTGEKLAIRSDITVQIIKAAANRRLPLDQGDGFCYIQSVFQNQPWGSGTQREYIQAGVEWIGDKKNRFEAMLNLSKQLAPQGLDFHFIYGDASFVNIIAQWFPEHLRKKVASLFHNKDSESLSQICDEINLDDSKKKIVVQTPLHVGEKSDTIEDLQSLCKKEPELLKILDHAKNYDQVFYDFSIVSELSYYTGPVFEGYLEGSHKKIISGGIYDELYSEFSSQSKVACGFAVDITSLIKIEQG